MQKEKLENLIQREENLFQNIEQSSEPPMSYRPPIRQWLQNAFLTDDKETQKGRDMVL